MFSVSVGGGQPCLAEKPPKPGSMLLFIAAMGPGKLSLLIGMDPVKLLANAGNGLLKCVGLLSLERMDMGEPAELKESPRE